MTHNTCCTKWSGDTYMWETFWFNGWTFFCREWRKKRASGMPNCWPMPQMCLAVAVGAFSRAVRGQFHIVVLRVRLDKNGEHIVEHRVRSRPSFLAQFSVAWLLVASDDKKLCFRRGRRTVQEDGVAQNCHHCCTSLLSCSWFTLFPCLSPFANKWKHKNHPDVWRKIILHWRWSFLLCWKPRRRWIHRAENVRGHVRRHLLK